MKQQLQNKIINFFIKRVDLIAIYLFGSVVTDNFTYNSDIDIALIMEERIENQELYEMQVNFAVILNRDVDLIDFKNIPPGLAMQVLKTGMLIYCNDKEKRLLVEINKIKEYQMLNEEREIVIKSICGNEFWEVM